MLNRALLLALLLVPPAMAVAASNIPLPRERPAPAASKDAVPLPRERPPQLQSSSEQPMPSSAEASSSEPASR